MIKWMKKYKKFISIFDPNKRIDFTKVFDKRHNKIGICGSLDVQKYGSKFGCCVCVGYCKKFPALAQALSKHLRTCENKGIYRTCER